MQSGKGTGKQSVGTSPASGLGMRPAFNVHDLQLKEQVPHLNLTIILIHLLGGFL